VRQNDRTESQHTVLIVFLWVLLIASLCCCWLTPALEWPLLSQVLCVWKEKASNIKYFREEVSPRAKATQSDHIETLSVYFYFLRFVLLNVRIYVTASSKRGRSDKMNLQADSELEPAGKSEQLALFFCFFCFYFRTSRDSQDKAYARHLFGSLLHIFQRTRLTWIVVIPVNGNWQISAMLFRLELSYTKDTTAAAE